MDESTNLFKSVNEKEGYMKMIFSFHQAMQKHGFSLVYEGEITHQITKAFTSLAENNMERLSEDLTVKKKVFHVMVECLQNLTKHSEDLNTNDTPFAGNGVFIVGKLNNIYHVITGNPINKEGIDDLKAMLDKINSLDKESLKELYKQQMKDGALSEKGGAGLGLIDIARKTGEKLEYHFEEMDEKRAFFLLKTSVVKTQAE